MEQIDYITLDETVLPIKSYQEEFIDGKRKITVAFDVSSSEYHDITTLLYKQSFAITVAEKNISFYGAIWNFYTSITNLYEQDNVGAFTVTFVEKKEKQMT